MMSIKQIKRNSRETSQMKSYFKQSLLLVIYAFSSLFVVAVVAFPLASQ